MLRLVSILFFSIISITLIQSQDLIGKIESCSGWSLNKLPQLKSFLKDGEAESYQGVSVEYIHGRKAVLTIYNKNDEELEKITLSDYKTKEEMHALFQEKGKKKAIHGWMHCCLLLLLLAVKKIYLCCNTKKVMTHNILLLSIYTIIHIIILVGFVLKSKEEIAALKEKLKQEEEERQRAKMELREKRKQERAQRAAEQQERKAKQEQELNDQEKEVKKEVQDMVNDVAEKAGMAKEGEL